MNFAEGNAVTKARFCLDPDWDDILHDVIDTTTSRLENLIKIAFTVTSDIDANHLIKLINQNGIGIEIF